MKNNLALILVYLSLLVIHLLCIDFGLLKGIFEQHLKVNVFLFALFSLGFLIVLPGFKKGPEQFSIRFLAMTTLQLLLMLTLILILSFNKIADVKYLGFTSISLFAILLIIQSTYLIKKMNRK
jgi:hypothetical protein